MTDYTTSAPPSHRVFGVRSRPYFWWVVGTMLGAISVVITPSIAVRLFASMVPSLYLERITDLLSACLWALPQWFVLRRYLRRSALWFVPVVLGWFLLTSGDVQLSVWRGVGCLFLMTVGQWLILWLSGISAHWWLLINPLAFLLAGGLIAVTVFPLTFLLNTGDYGAGERAVVAAVSLGAALYAGITGWLLFRHWKLATRSIQ